MKILFATDGSAHALAALKALIDHLDWFYGSYFVLGLAIFALATYLWMAEYRSSHLQTRHGSPA